MTADLTPADLDRIERHAKEGSAVLLSPQTVLAIVARVKAAEAEAARLRATLHEIAGYTSSEWARKTALATLEAK